MPTLAVFITLAVTLAIGLTVVVLIPWLRADKSAANNQLIALNVELFEDRISELDTDYKAGLINESAYYTQKTELQRQLLQASDDLIIKPQKQKVNHISAMQAQIASSSDDFEDTEDLEAKVESTDSTSVRSAPVVTRQSSSRQSSLVMLAWLPVLMGICYVLFSDIKTVSSLWQAQDSMGQVADDLLTGRIDAPPDWAAENDLALLNVIQTNVYQNAEDADRWLRLSDIFMVYQVPIKSTEAMSRAYRLNPTDEAIAISYAQLQIFANNGELNPEGRSALKSVLQQNPNHQRAQMLMLMGEVGAGNYAQAKIWLAKLRNQLVANDGDQSAAVASLDELSEQITVWEQELQANNQADSQANMLADNQESQSAALTEQDTLAISISVTINPSLLPLIDTNDLLFVTVSEDTGGAPLAAQRIPAESLLKANADGLQLELGDNDAMMPNRTISNALAEGKSLVVTARISKSGQAITESGDLAAVPVPIVEDADTVNIIISEQVP